MELTLVFLASGIVGYGLGSIPTGYLLGRWVAGIDIREQGSGSMGATNVLRTLGKGPAVTVLLVDALKGILAVNAAGVISTRFLPEAFSSWTTWIVILAAFLAIIGHSRPVWLGFRGGKSVATSLGILLALSWPVALSVFGVWMLGFGGSRIVSFSSVLGAVSASIWMVVFQQPLAYILFALAGGVYVITTHRRNIERLLAGTEPRMGQQSGQQASDPANLGQTGEAESTSPPSPAS